MFAEMKKKKKCIKRADDWWWWLLTFEWMQFERGKHYTTENKRVFMFCFVFFLIFFEVQKDHYSFVQLCCCCCYPLTIKPSNINCNGQWWPHAMQIEQIEISGPRSYTQKSPDYSKWQWNDNFNNFSVFKRLEIPYTQNPENRLQRFAY